MEKKSKHFCNYYHVHIFSGAASSHNFTTQIESGIALIEHDEFSHLFKTKVNIKHAHLKVIEKVLNLQKLKLHNIRFYTYIQSTNKKQW